MDLSEAVIKKLMRQRQHLRKIGKFAQADAIRKKIEKLGYVVVDDKSASCVRKREPEIKHASSPLLILLGSDTMTPSGRNVHEYILNKINKKEPQIALITTPAGFQPNVGIVYQEIADFFEQSLQNFHPQVRVIFANNFQAANDPKIIKQLAGVDYIFTGPGSPTYAIRSLKNSLLYKKMIEMVKNGTSMALSSAATIAFSHYALPVYEIYKVGEDLHWQEGLNFYKEFYQEMTVIPHVNNQEGGRKTDTSYCYIGKERFTKLRRLLPQKEPVIGIDEHTALVIDLKTKKALVLGKGKIHPLESSIPTTVKP